MKYIFSITHNINDVSLVEDLPLLAYNIYDAIVLLKDRIRNDPFPVTVSHDYTVVYDDGHTADGFITDSFYQEVFNV